MLPKSQRLNLKKDFKWVAAGKKLETTRPSSGGKYLKLFIRFGENEKPRVGVALSGKNFKKAVERNRARRIVSQAFQTLYSSLPNNINIMALPKTGVLEVKSGDVLSDLETALKDKNLLIAEP